MSLYANLLNKKPPAGAGAGANNTSPAVISSEPVKYSFKKSDDELKEEKKAADAALRFQPVKRPQVQQQRARPRGIPPSSSPDKQLPPAQRKERKAPPAASAEAGGDSIENWIDEEADDYYVAEYTRHKEEEKERQRENKRRRKKKKNQHETREVDYNAIYNPEQPTRLDEYKGSVEALDARLEWKQLLHAHQHKEARKAKKANADSQAIKAEKAARASREQDQDFRPRAFAPPSNYNFAPPPPTDDAPPHSRTATQSFNRVPPPSSLGNEPPPNSFSYIPAAATVAAHVDEDDDYEPPPAAMAPSVADHLVAVGNGPYPSANQPTRSPSAAPPFISQSNPARPQPDLAYPPPPGPGMDGMPLPPGPWQNHPGGAPPPPLPGMGYPPPPPPGLGFSFPPPPPGMAFPPPPHLLAAQASANYAPVLAPPPQNFTPPAAPTPPPPPVQPSSSAAVISRAPVRFTQPSPSPTEEAPPVIGGLGFKQPSEPPSDNEANDDTPRSKAPGQKGFAKRLLQKYGWKEGEGLGANSSGITTILQHQTQKRKKKPDAEGGGWGSSPAIGRIVGGKKRKIEGQDEEEADGNGVAGKWSIVARFEGMLTGMDIDHEIGEGDLMQRMGEKMAEYGHVERLFIHRGDQGVDVDATVFVKFTSALSAYRAVQASHEKDFLGNGRVVRSGFWDEDKFAKDIFQ